MSPQPSPLYDALDLARNLAHKAPAVFLFGLLAVSIVSLVIFAWCVREKG